MFVKRKRNRRENILPPIWFHFSWLVGVFSELLASLRIAPRNLHLTRDARISRCAEDQAVKGGDRLATLAHNHRKLGRRRDNIQEKTILARHERGLDLGIVGAESRHEIGNKVLKLGNGKGVSGSHMSHSVSLFLFLSAFALVLMF